MRKLSIRLLQKRKTSTARSQKCRPRTAIRPARGRGRALWRHGHVGISILTMSRFGPRCTRVLARGSRYNRAAMRAKHEGREEHMSTIEKSIEVNVPEYTAHAQCNRVEELPTLV